MNFKNKIIIKKHNSHRRLWLSSIITLFIFATSISAYFLVKNSQDIRKSADEPYENECTCIYNSSCSAVNMKPCEGQCNPSCNYPAICCQAITEDLCTQGNRYCVDSNTLAICKPDKSGYTVTNCASGTSCDSSQRACVSNTYPTPIPSSTPIPAPCTSNGGVCFYSGSCADGNRLPMDGYCSYPGFCCGPISDTPLCTPGDRACISDTQLSICKADGSGYTVTNCSSGTKCDSSQRTCIPLPTSAPTCTGTCYTNSSCSAIGREVASGTCRLDTSVCCQTEPRTTTCEGTCYTNSSCAAIGKVPATGTCLYDTSVCCKESNTPTCEGTCYTNASSCTSLSKTPASGTCLYDTSVCCKEPTTPTCEGTCYTNSSCSAIGKVAASGSCLYSTSVCCQEKAADTPIQVEGASCEGSCYNASSCGEINKDPAEGLCVRSLWSLANLTGPSYVCCQEKQYIGLKPNGAQCENDSDCESGHCYGETEVWWGGGMGAGFSAAVNDSTYGKTCQPIAYQELNKDIQVASVKAYGQAYLTAISMVSGIGPIIQVFSATSQVVQAQYTCDKSSELQADPNVDQATKDQFSRACLLSVISAGTSMIGGGASFFNDMAGTALTASTQLALRGVSTVDNVGNLVVSAYNVESTCNLYGLDSIECFKAKANAGIAIGSTVLAARQFGADYSAYSTQKLYEFYENNPYDSYNSYVNSYGEPPSTLQTIRDPNKLYSFQELAIEAAKNPTRANFQNTFEAIKSQEGVDLKFRNRSEMDQMFGPGVGGVCVPGKCGGFLGIGSKRTATVYLLDPNGTRITYNKVGYSLNEDEVLQVIMQKAGHEAGHAYDLVKYGLSDVWASEYRQKQFNAMFYDAIGQESLAKDYWDFLELVDNNSDVYFIPGQ